MNHIGNKVKMIVIAFLVIALYCIPIVCIKIVSDNEVSEYKSDIKYDFKEKAYGRVITPIRGDIREYYTIRGEVTSEKYHIVKIPKAASNQIMYTVKKGDEVHTGEVIGKAGSQNIYSSRNGIVDELHTGEEAYVRLLVFDNLILKSKVDKNILSHLKDVMYDENDNKYTLISKSYMCTDDGIEVKYAMSKTDYKYGEKVKDLDFYTGETFSDVLLINSNCVYQKTGMDEYYVRVCDRNGVFKEEREVNVGFEYKDMISIVGIDEGEYCDSGYKYILNDEQISSDDVQSY